MKTTAPDPESHLSNVRHFRWWFLLLVPALSLSGQPVADIQRAAIISWPTSANEYIVVSSPTSDGPWVPCLEPPIASWPGVAQVAVLTTDPMREYRLASGTRVTNDFNDGEADLTDWLYLVDDPQFTNIVTKEFTNGHLRISGTCSTCEKPLAVVGTNVALTDFAASIDILDWDEQPGDLPYVALVARADPTLTRVPPDGNIRSYAGGVSPENENIPGRSVLWIVKARPDGSEVGWPSSSFPKMDPSKDYRLVFSGAGNQFQVQLLDLATGELVKDFQHTDTEAPLPPGIIGFYVGENGPSGTLDITVDNYVAVGTVAP